MSASSRSTVPGGSRSVTMRSRSSWYARSAKRRLDGAPLGGRGWWVRRPSGCASIVVGPRRIACRGGLRTDISRWMTRADARAGGLARRRCGARRAGAHARPRPPHAGAHLPQPLRRVRRHRAAQGGEPAADRLVQAARRAGQGRPVRPPAPAWSPGAPATTRSRSPTPRAPAGWPARCSCRPRRRSPRRRRCAASAGPCGWAATSVDECVARARERAAETGAVFVHPFDDAEIVAGQGTLGLELLEDVPELATVVVPVGGGGLIGGVAGIVKAARPARADRRRPGRGLLRLPRLAGRRGAGRGPRAADDRRRHRDQAAGRADAAARRRTGSTSS